MVEKKRKYPPKKKQNDIVPATLKLDWSKYQKDIFRDIAKGQGNTIVIARAGAAKTTSLVQGSKYLPRKKSSLFCAFNKHVQETLRMKLGSYVECLTLHSLGFRAIKLRFGDVELNNRKCWDLVRSFIGDSKDDYDLIDQISKTVSFCKASLVDTPSSIEEMIFKYGIDLCEVSMKQFIQYVSMAIRMCKEQTEVIDFDDMIWFPFVYRLNVGKYDYVFIDESQDLNKAQIELALSACKIDGRVVAVLDPAQAIYGWRGADTDVLDNLKERLQPKELPLPICYRCPKKVVLAAQEFVPDIQPFDKAPEGEITDLSVGDLRKTAKAGDYVISRYNAPLIKHCLNFLKHGVPSNILGRDIGSNLLYLIKKSKKKTVRDFLKWLIKWEKQEKQRLLDKYPNASTESISDKAECLRNLCEDTTSLDEVKKNINMLFKDNEEKNIVLFSSIHRIKGKETDRVFVLADTLNASSQEELNLHYVAITRAKKHLYMVYKKMPVVDYGNDKVEALWNYLQEK